VVSLFAALSDAVEPKSLAGLLGAAPSIALATLGLTLHFKGRPYATEEARSMVLGAVSFLVYARVVSSVLLRRRTSALSTALLLLILWAGCALGLWYTVER